MTRHLIAASLFVTTIGSLALGQGRPEDRPSPLIAIERPTIHVSTRDLVGTDRQAFAPNLERIGRSTEGPRPLLGIMALDAKAQQLIDDPQVRDLANRAVLSVRLLSSIFSTFNIATNLTQAGRILLVIKSPPSVQKVRLIYSLQGVARVPGKSGAQTTFFGREIPPSIRGFLKVMDFVSLAGSVRDFKNQAVKDLISTIPQDQNRATPFESKNNRRDAGSREAFARDAANHPRPEVPQLDSHRPSAGVRVGESSAVGKDVSKTKERVTQAQPRETHNPASGAQRIQEMISQVDHTDKKMREMYRDQSRMMQQMQQDKGIRGTSDAPKGSGGPGGPRLEITQRDSTRSAREAAEKGCASTIAEHGRSTGSKEIAKSEGGGKGGRSGGPSGGNGRAGGSGSSGRGSRERSSRL
jgi:uncharacterized membrane protein YgcG